MTAGIGEDPRRAGPEGLGEPGRGGQGVKIQVRGDEGLTWGTHRRMGRTCGVSGTLKKDNAQALGIVRRKERGLPPTAAQLPHALDTHRFPAHLKEAWQRDTDASICWPSNLAQRQRPHLPLPSCVWAIFLLMPVIVITIIIIVAII